METEINPGTAQAFYEDFSLAVGQRDWLQPNPRHQQLKILIRRIVGGRRDLRIADVGCGAGVLTDYLTRYGTVVGIDFSTAAIAAAHRYAPTPTFLAGGVDELPDDHYDVITLFDVLEHIPAADRPAFIASIGNRLAPDGLLFCSTPFPDATRRKRAMEDKSLQIIDEEVELPDVISEAAASGLQLLSFEAYDVFAGSPEYQAMVFTPARSPDGDAVLLSRQFRLWSRLFYRSDIRKLRRWRYAARALRHGDLPTARWFVTAQVPDVDS